MMNNTGKSFLDEKKAAATTISITGARWFYGDLENLEILREFLAPGSVLLHLAHPTDWNSTRHLAAADYLKPFSLPGIHLWCQDELMGAFGRLAWWQIHCLPYLLAARQSTNTWQTCAMQNSSEKYYE